MTSAQLILGVLWVAATLYAVLTGALNDLLTGLAFMGLSTLQHHRVSRDPFGDFQPTEPGAVS